MHRPLAFILGGICGVGLAAGAVAAEPARATRSRRRRQIAAPPKTKAAAPAADDSALKQRVEQLEEQLVDMQAAIGSANYWRAAAVRRPPQMVAASVAAPIACASTAWKRSRAPSREIRN